MKLASKNWVPQVMALMIEKMIEVLVKTSVVLPLMLLDAQGQRSAAYRVLWLRPSYGIEHVSSHIRATAPREDLEHRSAMKYGFPGDGTSFREDSVITEVVRLGVCPKL